MNLQKIFLLCSLLVALTWLTYPRMSLAQSNFEIVPPTNCRPGNCSRILVKGLGRQPFAATIYPVNCISGLDTGLTSDAGDRVFLFEPGEYAGPIFLCVAVSVEGKPLLFSAAWTSGDSPIPPPQPNPLNPYPLPSAELKTLVDKIRTDFQSVRLSSAREDTKKISAFFGEQLVIVSLDKNLVKTTADFRAENVKRIKESLGVIPISTRYPFFSTEVESAFKTSFGLQVQSLDVGNPPLRSRIADLCRAVAWAVWEGGVR